MFDKTKFKYMFVIWGFGYRGGFSRFVACGRFAVDVHRVRLCSSTSEKSDPGKLDDHCHPRFNS
jgi:hypothetical protein